MHEYMKCKNYINVKMSRHKCCSKIGSKKGPTPITNTNSPPIMRHACTMQCAVHFSTWLQRDIEKSGPGSSGSRSTATLLQSHQTLLRIERPRLLELFCTDFRIATVAEHAPPVIKVALLVFPAVVACQSTTSATES